jgi:Trypsin-like peptidase domain
VRIGDEFLECVVYIYPNEEDANDGREAGGSGFLVNFPTPEEGKDRVFVVTNRHVIEHLPAPVVRVNRTDGSFDSIRTNKIAWKIHPEGDDIAAIDFTQRSAEHSIRWVDIRTALPEHKIQDFNIGIGDTVAMLGRLIGHDGKVRNSPIARFGTIAMMPGDKIKNTFNADQETYLIECHSVPGFSGSPVFLFLNTSTRSLGGHQLVGIGPWLLGIDWYHASNIERVRDENGAFLGNGLYVKSNTGVAGVIPATRILHLLNAFDL